MAGCTEMTRSGGIRKGWALVAIAAALALASLPIGQGSAANIRGTSPDRDPGSTVVEGSYIVVYEDGVGRPRAKTAQAEARVGFEARFDYTAALRGFSARLTPVQVRQLEGDPAVAYVAAERRVKALDMVPLAPGEGLPPTGVRRIRAATRSTAHEASMANVAVVDTGIQIDHPELNAVDGTDCVNPGTPASDENGHGTHVGGTIAAKNNGHADFFGRGVVGVAPGTKLYAVRVLDELGRGTTGSLICGVDWVTAHHDSDGIEVANMSLGGLGTPVEPCAESTDPLHTAICNSTAAGVSYVVAAGNEGWDFDYAAAPDTPAAYPEVLTVTAISDADGEAGQDAPASFSSYAGTARGALHTVAAPGVGILSAGLGGGFRGESGTSMATPHVAGALALCFDEAGTDGPCAGETSAQAIATVRADAQSYTGLNPEYGFENDPVHDPLAGRFYGFLTRALIGGDAIAPVTTITSGPSGPTADTAPVFTFQSNEQGVTFECTTDWGNALMPFATCSSPYTSRIVIFDHLPDGKFTFRVRARDRAANLESPSVTRSFLVDTAPPVSEIRNAPARRTHRRSAVFGFRASEPAVVFRCKLDGRGWKRCASPRRYRRLSPGRHAFQLQATDLAGNVEAAPVLWRWTIRR